MITAWMSLAKGSYNIRGLFLIYFGLSQWIVLSQSQCCYSNLNFFMASTLGGGCSIVGRAITSIINYTGFKSLQGHNYGTNSDGN